MGELIFELVLPTIGRFIVFLLVELLFQIIFYFTGYPIVKMLTLGAYPKVMGESDGSDNVTSIIGLMVWLALIVVFIA
ncbi:hypothetical protein [Enterovibrio norvegicus]|uniref:hypothetical protein n=1 Tax=Enterovibrio norvegicus TaxID=188144 RepID=UPI003550231A